MNDLATWVLFIWLVVDTVITLLQQKSMDNFDKFTEMELKLWNTHLDRHEEIDKQIEELKKDE